MWKSIAKLFLKLLFRPEIRMGHLREALIKKEKVVLAPHYASYLDPVLFGIFSPGSPTVVISPTLERKKWFRFFRGTFAYVVVDLQDPFSLKQLDDLLEKNDYVVLFPEPEPTTSGLLMKLSETVVAAAEKSGAWVVPARAVNTQFTHFSRMGERLVRKRSIRVTLFTWNAAKLSDAGAPAGKRPKDRRFFAYLKLEQMLMDTMMQSIWDKKPIFDTLLEQRRLWGGKHVVAIEPDGGRIDWNGLLARIFLIRHLVEFHTQPGERFGIMLPNTTMTLASIIGTQYAGRQPAMINYSMGARALKAACALAAVGKIVTSRRFIEEGKFQPLVDELTAAKIELLYLEDLIASIPTSRKISLALAARFASPTPEAAKRAAETALVLFTSGSEGTPKAVALSHLNIQANTAQVRTTLDFYQTDVLLNIMPMFHSFGLSTGTFMPLSAGMAVAFYPTPLHYKKIPHYAYETGATVLLGTNAFLAGYAKNADPFDFFEMRYVVCGGDKLREGTADLWVSKFGIRILEGYGVTEGSPVVGVNRLGRCRPGSIGRPLPCVEATTSPVDGVAEGGRLVIRGPNVMLGYIQSDGSILPPPEAGYDTGDIVTIDEEGYITIKGRAKRFAKIGGEMVSLTQIEEAVQEIWPDEMHAAVSIPDENRGEIIVLLTERASPDREALRSALTGKGLPELALPKKVLPVEALPKIGVGKIDYQTAAQLAEAR